MKKLLFIYPIIFLLTACQVSPRLYKYNQPGPIKLSKTQIDSLSVVYKGYDAVYLKNESITEHFYYFNWKKSKSYNQSYVIFNPQDKDISTFSYEGYGKNVNNINLRVIYPDQKIVEFHKDDCQIEKTASSEVYKIAYPNITEGTIIQESVDYECHPSAQDSYILKKSLPMIENKIIFVMPDYWESQIKNKDVHIDKITIIKEKEKNILQYSDQNIEAYHDEVFSPTLQEMNGILSHKIIKASAFGMFQNIEYCDDYYWSEVFSSIKEYVDQAANKNNFSLKKIIKNMEPKCSSKLELADSIVTYMQNNFECDYSSNYYISSMEYSIQQKKANPLFITGFTKQLLSMAKIDSDIIFCHSEAEGPIDFKYVSQSQFNIPALFINIDNKKYFALPYVKYLNFRNTPSQFKNSKYINMFTPENIYLTTIFCKDKDPGKRNEEIKYLFADIPFNDEEKNYIKETYNIFLNQDGIVNIKEKIELSNIFNYQIKPSFENKKSEELEKMIREFLAIKVGNVKLITYNIENLNDINQPFVINIEYTIDNLLTVLPDEMIFQTSDLLTPASINNYKIKPTDRKNPIKIDENQSYIKDIYIHFPENMTVQTQLTNKTEANQFGSFANEWKIENNTLNIYQTRNLKRISAPKEDYSLLLNVSSEDINNDISNIIFSLKD